MAPYRILSTKISKSPLPLSFVFGTGIYPCWSATPYRNSSFTPKRIGPRSCLPWFPKSLCPTLCVKKENPFCFPIRTDSLHPVFYVMGAIDTLRSEASRGPDKHPEPVLGLTQKQKPTEEDVSVVRDAGAAPGPLLRAWPAASLLPQCLVTRTLCNSNTPLC